MSAPSVCTACRGAGHVDCAACWGDGCPGCDSGDGLEGIELCPGCMGEGEVWAGSEDEDPNRDSRLTGRELGPVGR